MCVFRSRYDFFGPSLGGGRSPLAPPVDPPLPDVQDQDRIFWSQTGLVLRPTVSDHITGLNMI